VDGEVVDSPAVKVCSVVGSLPITLTTRLTPTPIPMRPRTISTAPITSQSFFGGRFVSGGGTGVGIIPSPGPHEGGFVDIAAPLNPVSITQTVLAARYGDR
jgi:hypothetical protein